MCAHGEVCISINKKGRSMLQDSRAQNSINPRHGTKCVCRLTLVMPLPCQQPDAVKSSCLWFKCAIFVWASTQLVQEQSSTDRT